MEKRHIVRKMLAYVMAFAMVISCVTMGKLGTFKAKAAELSVYPYATDMDKKSITLHAGATGTSYQWQKATAVNGSYVNIADATSETYTLEPEESAWYRCVINGNTTKSIQAIQEGNNEFDFCNAESSQWYVTNGLLAYSVWDSTKFDVVGLYTRKDGKQVWLCTSYNEAWTMNGCGDLTVHFGSNVAEVLINATASADKMMVVTDTMLGDYENFTYADDASLKAILDNNDDYTTLKQIQMVGAKSLDDAEETDPAFVFTPITTPTAYFLSSYNQSGWGSTYGYNPGSAYYDSNYVKTNGIVTEVQDEDSAMNVSWTNLSVGDTVSFKYSVGDVSSTGAVITKVTSKSIVIKNSDPEIYYALYDKDGNVIYDWVLGNGEDIIFDGLQQNTEYVLKTVEKKKYNDGNPTSTDDKNVSTAIDPIKPTGDTPIPTIEVTETTLTIKNPVEGYTYKLLDIKDNTINGTKNGNGDYVFTGLKAGAKYFIIANTEANPNSDKVEKSTIDHDWNVTAEDDTFTIFCNNAPEMCSIDAEHAMTVKVTCDAEKPCTITNPYTYSIENKMVTAGFAVGKENVKFYLADGTTLTSLENSGSESEGTAPLYCGNYEMRVTVLGESLSFPIKIAHDAASLSELHKAVVPTCIAGGNVAYYECADCGLKSDENGNYVATAELEKDPTNHVGETEIKNAKEATDDAPGYTGDTYCKSCGAKIKAGSVIPAKLPAVSVAYHTHIQSIGDKQETKKDGQMAGTSGEAKRLENISLKVDGNDKLGIQYTAHCQTYGWLPWAANGETCGTSGEAKRLEAVKIQLTGPDKDKYDVYYRVHSQTYGWLAWAKNGEEAGTAGEAKRLEGIQVLVVKKGEVAPGLDFMGVKASAEKHTDKKYIEAEKDNVKIPGSNVTPNVMYKTHVQTFGWERSWKTNGTVSGTFGQAKRLEGINIKLSNCDYAGGIRYMTHVQTFGWEKNWRANGDLSGTTGKAKRLEAIKIELTGDMAQHYDVYYRVHSQTYGWLAWAKNGEAAGTEGLHKRLEGIQIVLVEKDGKAPGATYEGITSKNAKAFIK